MAEAELRLESLCKLWLLLGHAAPVAFPVIYCIEGVHKVGAGPGVLAFLLQALAFIDNVLDGLELLVHFPCDLTAEDASRSQKQFQEAETDSLSWYERPSLKSLCTGVSSRSLWASTQ